jgi:hypothetical protein
MEAGVLPNGTPAHVLIHSVKTVDFLVFTSTIYTYKGVPCHPCDLIVEIGAKLRPGKGQSFSNTLRCQELFPPCRIAFHFQNPIA